MKPAPKLWSEQIEASEAPASPQLAELPQPNVLPDGRRKEGGRILFGLAVLGAGLLGANPGRE
jgi:hypothetical protein